MSVFLTSYATDRFAGVREELNASAARWGVSACLNYQRSDLVKSEYYRENRAILDEVCGGGYWAWKPFFILEALREIGDGDVLIYADAGSLFLDSVDSLISLCRENRHGLILFDARPLRNRQFTKRDCFVRMGCDTPRFWDANKVIATILVVRRTAFAVELIGEWLSYCRDRAVVTHAPNTCGLEDLPGFLQHRWDQAILSVLAAKYEMETFRNPTVWGNFLKMPEFRVPGELIVSPYHLGPPITDYSPKPQFNSPYGTLFEINRLPNYEGKPPALGALPPWKRALKKGTQLLRSAFRQGRILLTK